MSGGTSGSSTNPSEEPVLVGGAAPGVSRGPSLVRCRGTMLARSMAVRWRGSASSLSGT